MGSGGLAGPVWLGFGGAAEGDFEAEVAELADVVGDLTAEVGAALVVVRAEVLLLDLYAPRSSGLPVPGSPTVRNNVGCLIITPYPSERLIIADRSVCPPLSRQKE